MEGENIKYEEKPQEPFELTIEQTRDLIIEGMLAGMITTGGSDYSPPLNIPFEDASQCGDESLDSRF